MLRYKNSLLERILLERGESKPCPRPCPRPATHRTLSWLTVPCCLSRALGRNRRAGRAEREDRQPPGGYGPSTGAAGGHPLRQTTNHATCALDPTASSSTIRRHGHDSTPLKRPISSLGRLRPEWSFVEAPADAAVAAVLALVHGLRRHGSRCDDPSRV